VTTGPLLGVGGPVCRLCGKGLAEHATFHDVPTQAQLRGLVVADFGPPFDGLYCMPTEGP
jgi:hypothetical protein